MLLMYMTDTGTNTFPPYLLVAMTDQEIERRSIQVITWCWSE